MRSAVKDVEHVHTKGAAARIDASSPEIPDDFTEHERFLVKQTEKALIDGIQLERWARDPNRKITEFPLELGRTYQLENRPFGYFSDVTINGQTLTALGARQEVEFGKITGPHAEKRLKEYVLGKFLNHASWLYDNGDPGGYTLDQLLYCDANEHLGRYAKDNKTQIRDWREMGPKYRWSLFTIILHDFVFKLGSFKPPFIPQEAVTVVQSPDFVHIVENPKKGYKLEVAIGYPFIDYAPIPNFWGFGPGNFEWAVKTFSFLLREDGTIRCDMDFVAGPRPKKVFDFGNIPDPIYGPTDALKTATFGLFPAQKVHDYWDEIMAAQHCRVHQALMEGTAKIFAAMVDDGTLQRSKGVKAN
jgi:hypothetical protein